METIDYLREEIKSYFPHSAELQLSSTYAQQRRFNFYFKITDHYPYLLYLNWDGEYDRFILKCLEFADAQTLTGLMSEYPDKGARTFNIGQPKCTVSFIFHTADKPSVIDFKGPENVYVQSGEISGEALMKCVDPEGK